MPYYPHSLDAGTRATVQVESTPVDVSIQFQVEVGHQVVLVQIAGSN